MPPAETVAPRQAESMGSSKCTRKAAIVVATRTHPMMTCRAVGTEKEMVILLGMTVPEGRSTGNKVGVSQCRITHRNRYLCRTASFERITHAPAWMQPHAR